MDRYIHKAMSRGKGLFSNKAEHYDKEKLFRSLIEEDSYNDQLTEEEAYYLVSQMYHISNGRRVTGEQYDMTKAKEICHRFQGVIPSENSYIDVYVAINAQYHDYCELFKAWFGENIDTKVFESAVNFWFKDDDYTNENKVYKYFNM